MQKYIITGGPCTGKSTTVGALVPYGYEVVPEASRMIIDVEQAKEDQVEGSGILPGRNQRGFEQLVIQKQLELEGRLHFGKGKGRFFLDRCLVDNLAYAELTSFDLFTQIKDAIKSAGYGKVFFLEQLPVYKNDKARKEKAEQAKVIHEKIFELYHRLGYDVVSVPPVTVEERVNLILGEVQEKKHREIERKYRANHADVIGKLSSYHVERLGKAEEENRLYDLFGILERQGLVFRLRDTGVYLLTLKGKDRGVDIKDRTEFEFELPQFLYKLLSKILPESLRYPKTREVYSPFGDSHCKICLDTIPDLGEFVEVEAKSRNQVLLWEKKLGLTDVVQESYPELVRLQGRRV